MCGQLILGWMCLDSTFTDLGNQWTLLQPAALELECCMLTVMLCHTEGE
jgi:hypothetical protein